MNLGYETAQCKFCSSEVEFWSAESAGVRGGYFFLSHVQTNKLNFVDGR